MDQCPALIDPLRFTVPDELGRDLLFKSFPEFLSDFEPHENATWLTAFPLRRGRDRYVTLPGPMCTHQSRFFSSYT